VDYENFKIFILEIFNMYYLVDIVNKVKNIPILTYE